MRDNKFIKKIAQGILKKGQKPALDNHIMHPRREWIICILVGLSLFAVSVFVTVNLYRDYSNIVFEKIEVTETAVTIYRENEIKAALEALAKKQEAHEAWEKSITDVTKNISSPSTIKGRAQEIMAPTDNRLETPGEINFEQF